MYYCEILVNVLVIREIDKNSKIGKRKEKKGEDEKSNL